MRRRARPGSRPWERRLSGQRCRSWCGRRSCCWGRCWRRSCRGVACSRWSWSRCSRWSWSWCTRWRWRWGATAAYVVEGHAIPNTPSVLVHFVYYYHNALPVRQVERERSHRIGTAPYVGKVVLAQVGRVKAAQVCLGKDEFVAYARHRVHRHRHTLGRASRVGESVRIVMVRGRVKRARAYLGRRTEARNTVAEHSTSHCRIARR